ncbi:hypothetical protein C8F04DRAFT_1391997 [Mycena alexandri]|uniref:Uncharacterized protein n=1 Tax=Mycena alexandri TaxID=1745969 RepID=A0AAD6X9N0_9AGAR|nr:hypothetical protein C8F04DRAFT_1391997 [Mycena alexandri]
MQRVNVCVWFSGCVCSPSALMCFEFWDRLPSPFFANASVHASSARAAYGPSAAYGRVFLRRTRWRVGSHSATCLRAVHVVTLLRCSLSSSCSFLFRLFLSDTGGIQSMETARQSSTRQISSATIASISTIAARPSPSIICTPLPPFPSRAVLPVLTNAQQRPKILHSRDIAPPSAPRGHDDDDFDLVSSHLRVRAPAPLPTALSSCAAPPPGPHSAIQLLFLPLGSHLPAGPILRRRLSVRVPLRASPASPARQSADSPNRYFVRAPRVTL